MVLVATSGTVSVLLPVVYPSDSATRRVRQTDEAMSELTWGDEVRIKLDAPPEYRPGATAWAVGFREDPADPPAMLVIVEFEDGSSVEVPEDVVAPIK
jgi:hypothetical protein